jgi:hypothetical protein
LKKKTKCIDKTTIITDKKQKPRNKTGTQKLNEVCKSYILIQPQPFENKLKSLELQTCKKQPRRRSNHKTNYPIKACITKNKERNEKNMQANYLVTKTIPKRKAYMPS